MDFRIEKWTSARIKKGKKRIMISVTFIFNIYIVTYIVTYIHIYIHA